MSETMQANDTKYKISNLCIETYPCKHSVLDDKTNIRMMMCGDDIYGMLKNEGEYIPNHFMQYKQFYENKMQLQMGKTAHKK
jgi:hypothetical protein